MIVKFDSCKGSLLLAVLGIMVVLGAVVLAAGQGINLPAQGTTIPEQGINISGEIINTSGPDSAYCTGNGYFYTTMSGVNSGKPICRFPDGTWCDAHAYFTGDCAASTTNISVAPNLTYTPGNPYMNVNNINNPYAYTSPYMYNNPQGALDIADATKICQSSGGVVQSVHTSYGDVNMCVFPDGSYIDLMGLYSTVYGGIPGENWYYNAYYWLNAP
jgi:putative hemolysin